MDPHYAMAKFGLESKDILRSRQKGCWHYTKYFFIFSSIIQFLIILGLVLFMLYGNAHVTTENRLQTLEQRYKNLTFDYLWLQGNFSALKGKLAGAEKQVQNGTQIIQVQTKQMENMNRTIIFMRTQMSPDCRRLQIEMERLNMTCTNDRLQSQNYRFTCEADSRQYKENCTKSVNDLTIREQIATTEMKRLQLENTDLRNQLRLYQESCIKMDEKFREEIEHMKRQISAYTYDSYGASYKCKALTETTSNAIDQSIMRLRQDVNNVILENSQMKVTQGRTSDDLRKCNHDKQGLAEERNRLVTEKTGIQKELTDKTNDLTKSFSQYMKKLEELENCQKMQFSRYPSRP